MAESTRIVGLVQERIDAHLQQHQAHLAEISSDLDSFISISQDLLAGGKRFRALFSYWGWRAVRSDDREGDLPGVVLAATALEVFHAAALVHDDIMDNSDTRRGFPSAHKRFEKIHRDGALVGDPAAFGRSAALLLGDLLLAWSDELFGHGLAMVAERASAVGARSEFNTMRTEVTLGQYLDVLEEGTWTQHPENELRDRANRVILYKSAKYSVEAPLAIGAVLGGAHPEQLATLRAFGQPLGIAFQLRDDLLGVFGDPNTTGKPAGDDLREGKRTVLVACARERIAASERDTLDTLLGDRGLTDDQIVVLQNLIERSGAIEEVESIIDDKAREAMTAIADAAIDNEALLELVQLATTVVRRSA
jgi:geranylgeranyl diphosphate synthase, type I